MNHHDNHTSYGYRNRYYGIVIGSLVGIFIQLSSLCSNTRDFVHLLTLKQSQLSIDHHDDDDDTIGNNDHHISSLSFSDAIIPSEFSTWKFEWSIITTVMGIILLLTLRALVVVVLETYSTRTSNIESESTLVQIRNMEHAVATGTLWGVSIAWVITDYILGFSIPHTSSTDEMLRTTGSSMNLSSSYWYVPTLVSSVALLAWHVVVRFLVHVPTADEVDNDEADDDDDDIALVTHGLRQPLLVSNDAKDLPVIPTTSSIMNNTKSSCRRMVQLLSVGAGMMIGIFIQCSTLGVSYLGKFVNYSRTMVLSSSSSSSSSFTENITESIDISDPLSSSSTIQMFEGVAIGSSFIMSCIGLVLLLCIRAIITSMLKIQNDDNSENDPKVDTRSTHDCDEDVKRDDGGVIKSVDTIAITSSSSSSSSSSTATTNVLPLIETFILLHVEVYMATGTVIGLNLAWMVTDYTLFTIPMDAPQNYNLITNGFDSNYWYQFLLTLFVSTLWCPLLLYCAGFYSISRNQPGNDDNDDRTMWNMCKDDNHNRTTDCSTSGKRQHHLVAVPQSEEIIIIMTSTTVSSRTAVPILDPYDNDEEMAYM